MATDRSRSATAAALGASSASVGLSEGNATAEGLTEAALAAIDRWNAELRAFVTVDGDGALQRAVDSDRRRQAGEHLGPLDGLVVAVKDVIDVAGMPTGAGSRLRAGGRPREEDARAVAQLRGRGAVLIGKTHTHEFALGGTGENAYLGNAGNPYDSDRITGGSSSGSAIAVATGMAHAALGTDAGGSVRGPAALCGVVGFKPTFGAIDLSGAIPSGWSLDTMGVLAPKVADVALLLTGLAPSAAPGRAPASGGGGGWRVGLPGRYFAERLDASVRPVWQGALERLESDGWNLVTLDDWPDPNLSSAGDAVSWTINSAEAAAYHEPWLVSRPQLYGADIRQRLELGRCLLASEYLRAQRLRRFVQDELEPVWERVDLLITPACPTTAFPHGSQEIDLDGEPFPAATSLNRCFRIANLTGWPAISVPAGLSPEGLPVGIQLMAPAFRDARLLAAALLVEKCLAV